MGALLFSDFRVTNVKLINEKNSLFFAVSNDMDYVMSFLYLLTRLQKKFSGCELKEEWPHAVLYNDNRRQIEAFKWNV